MWRNSAVCLVALALLLGVSAASSQFAAAKAEGQVTALKSTPADSFVHRDDLSKRTHLVERLALTQKQIVEQLKTSEALLKCLTSSSGLSDNNFVECVISSSSAGSTPKAGAATQQTYSLATGMWELDTSPFRETADWYLETNASTLLEGAFTQRDLCHLGLNYTADKLSSCPEGNEMFGKVMPGGRQSGPCPDPHRAALKRWKHFKTKTVTRGYDLLMALAEHNIWNLWMLGDSVQIQVFEGLIRDLVSELQAHVSLTMSDLFLLTCPATRQSTQTGGGRDQA
jgi:hypothetical protein